jgi:hypothetical protein
MADYDVNGNATPPPTPPPPVPPAATPPPPLPSPQVPEAPPPSDASATSTPCPKPEVTLLKINARRAVCVSAKGDDNAPTTVVEVQIGVEGIPDGSQPVSASLDRMNAFAQAKLNAYLSGMVG